MENKLKYGKSCIGQKIKDTDGNVGVITDMYTLNGSKCCVDIKYSDGTTQTRNKYSVSKGRFKKPQLFDKNEYIEKGYVPVYKREKYYMINKGGDVISLHDRNLGVPKKSNNHYKYSSYKSSMIYSNPYKAVSLYREGKKTRKNSSVHKLVVETFIRPLKEDEEIDHINGVSSDNRLINLRIVTRRENNSKFLNFFSFLSEEEINYFEVFCEKNKMNLLEGLSVAVKTLFHKEVK